MKKEQLLSVLVILFVIVITPNFAIAKSTYTYHYNEKCALAGFEGELVDAYVFVSESVLNEVGPPDKRIEIVFFLNDGATLHYKVKDLATSEFKWSKNHVRVETEILGSTLVVEWTTMSPKQTDHENDKWKGGDIKGHDIDHYAWASTTLKWCEYELKGTGIIGRVSETTVIKVP